MFNATLNATKLFNINIVKTDVNVTSFIKEKNIKSLIVIPKGFEQTIKNSFVNPSAQVNLSFYFDPSEQTTTQVIRSVISSILQEMNKNLSQGRTIIGVQRDKHNY